MSNPVARYFDLTRSITDSRTTRDTLPPPTASHSSAGSLLQYLAVSAGVLAQPFFEAFQRGGSWSPNWKWLAFALIITLVIFPGVYRRSWDPDKPIFVQLCTIFAAGLGWQSLLKIGATALGQPTT